MKNHALFNEFLTYTRLDDAKNEKVIREINTTLLSSEQYLIGAGVKMPADFYFVDGEGKEVFSLHRLAIMILATHFYENRLAITPTTIKVAQIPIPYGLQSIILQLKWVDPDELSSQQ